MNSATSGDRIDLQIHDIYQTLVSEDCQPGSIERLIGIEGRCRYCGESDAKKFRNRAHTFPEFFGNKTLFSRDECDGCNKTFSGYENALATLIHPLRTLGGVRGKTGSPQLGLSGSAATMQTRPGAPRSMRIQTHGLDFRDVISFDGNSGHLRLSFPVPNASYVPAFAFKALVKMGLSILPQEELSNFSKLIFWLQGNSEATPPRNLQVVTSRANIINPVEIIQGVLLKRADSDDSLPRIIFLFSAGALCFQVTLESDNEFQEEVRAPFKTVGIRKQIFLNAGEGVEPYQISFSEPVIEDWSSETKISRAVEKINFDIGFA